MALTITPYRRNGIGEVSTIGSSKTVACDTAKGFRNIAVGAIIAVSGVNREVDGKVSETVVTITAAVDWSAASEWKYTNPVLSLTGFYYIKHNKSDKPTVTPINRKDSQYTYAARGAGVVREINISGYIQSSTIADVYNNMTILESLADGSQTKEGTCIFAEDVPPRTSYVYITSVNWKYARDQPKWLDVNVNMVECKNKGST